jgi:menaquinol-cytochrome c reductase iron-sulfur subunit
VHDNHLDEQVSPDVTVISRRSIFGALLGIGTAGMSALLAVPILRYVLYPLYAKSGKSEWSPVGGMNEFSNLAEPIQKTVAVKQLDGWREVDSAQTVYVTKGTDGQLTVLSAICPHLGCSVAWHQPEDEFICPCHGGRFAPDGKHVFGPPPRGMDPLQHKVVDGQLMIHFERFRVGTPNREELS